ncbi:hypothetical protein [Hanstruepera ponticola]|uniref:hypothetical protein n=1 Tax=Hanstruepera ponticola TaxID=2042995 RepID=UPI0017833F89|nr:hypothetical protein [Hanstruepera ponticola]
MKKLSCILMLAMFIACIPTQIAPTIETDKVQLAKKFKRDLPKSHAFIFEDPKKANEFYNFINMKYNREHQDVEYNVPIKINGNTYFLSFHEREKTTKTINLIPVLVDAKRESNGNSTIFDNYHTSRAGCWFILLTVYDNDFNDCLNPNYPNQSEILEHLREIKKEYLTTYNYMESYLDNN